MDCRTCQPTLLDLAYGELAPELAQVVRAHVNGCDSCGAALKALQQGIEGSKQLAWLEAPPAIGANIMAYAEQHARERAQAAVAAKAAAKPRDSFVQSVLDFMGRMASGRQFAMATVFVLVVTVGVWVIPELQPLPEGQGVTVVSPDPEGEAAPSGGLAPAEPLDLTVDQRSRRIRSREELEAAAQLAKSNAQTAQADELAEELAVQAPVPTTAPAAVAQRELERKAELSEEYEYALKESERPSSGKRRAERPAGEAFPESDIGALAAAPANELRDRGASKSATAPAPASRPVDDVLDSASSSGPSAEGKPASSEGTPARADKTVSSLERARTARSTQGCAAALPAYEQAVQEYSRSSPQSSVLGTALLELAECQWQLGRETAARATLKRASGIAPVAVRARAMLERDTEPATAKPAAPAAASAPSKD